MAREFGKLSYGPGYIGFSMGGHRGENGEPLCLLKRKICKNILFAAWRTPMTAQELAMEIGIALPYMEEELQLLTTATIMKKCGDAYAVNIPIASSVAVERIKAHLSGLLPEITQSLIDALEYRLAWLDENCPGWHGGYQSRQDMRWALLMRETEQLQWEVWNEYAVLMGKPEKREGVDYFPERPRGGRWNVVGLEGVFITELWPMSCQRVCSAREPNLPVVDFREYRYLISALQPSTSFVMQLREAQALVELVKGTDSGFSDTLLQRLLDWGYIRKNGDGYQPTVGVIREAQVRPMPPDAEKAYQARLGAARQLGLRHYLFCRETYAAEMSDSLRGDEAQIDYACEALSVVTGRVFEEARRIGYLTIREDVPNAGLGTLLII